MIFRSLKWALCPNLGFNAKLLDEFLGGIFCPNLTWTDDHCDQRILASSLETSNCFKFLSGSDCKFLSTSSCFTQLLAELRNGNFFARILQRTRVKRWGSSWVENITILVLTLVWCRAVGVNLPGSVRALNPEVPKTSMSTSSLHLLMRPWARLSPCFCWAWAF